MSNHDAVAGQYDRDGLLAAIETALGRQGLVPPDVTVDDLAPVDEFHVGGRPATGHLLTQLDFGPDAHVLDVGCGLGGAARLAASARVDRVTGVDLTAAYVEVGNRLNAWVGLDDRIDLRVGSALDMPFDDGSFDGGFLLHVGMNIDDKARLLAEVARVIRPGCPFGIYDLMRVGDGEPDYPVPWADRRELSHLGRPEDYRAAAEGAGWTVGAEIDRRAFAVEFFDRLEAASARPPLGLHLLMGPTAPMKIANLAAAIRSDVIAPVELVLRLR